MKTIRNKTHKPLKIPATGGKFLHLGPAKVGQISDKAAGTPALLKLVKAGEIELVADGAHGQGSGDGEGAVHSATHGHPQKTMSLPKGNR